MTEEQLEALAKACAAFGEEASRVAAIIQKVFSAWTDTIRAVFDSPAWHEAENFKYRPQRKPTPMSKAKVLRLMKHLPNTR